MAGEAAKHERHGWVRRDTSHIHNVGYLLTHWLMECRCGWLGWVAKGQ